MPGVVLHKGSRNALAVNVEFATKFFDPVATRKIYELRKWPIHGLREGDWVDIVATKTQRKSLRDGGDGRQHAVFTYLGGARYLGYRTLDSDKEIQDLGS